MEQIKNTPGSEPEQEQHDSTITLTLNMKNGECNLECAMSNVCGWDVLDTYAAITQHFARCFHEDFEEKMGVTIALLTKALRLGVEEEYKTDPDASDDPLSKLLNAMDAVSREAAEAQSDGAAN